MRHAPTSSLCAAAAIAAALTLGTTPAAAQDATPSLDLESLESTQPTQAPEAAPEAAETPEGTAVSPTASSDAPQPAAPTDSDPAEPATTASSIPVVPPTAVETDSAPAEPAATTASTTESTPAPAKRAEPTRSAPADPAPANPAPAPGAPATDEGSAGISDTGSDATDLMAETGEDSLTAAPMMDGTLPDESLTDQATAAADAPTEDPFSIPQESIVAMLAALGLGAAGFMAMRSRRRRREKPAGRRRTTLAAAMAFETKPGTKPTIPDVFKPKTDSTTPDLPEPKTDPTPDEPLTSIPDELAVREPASPEPQADKPAPAATSAFTPTATAFPGKPYVPSQKPQATTPDEPSAKPEAEGEPAPTGEARQKLIQEMVAAPPDEENPFTSVRARRKRARIILQRRENERHENEQGQQGDKPFDWRTHKPTTKSRNPSSPPLVSA